MVDDEQLTLGTADGELLTADSEVPDLGMMYAGRPALAGLNVVPSPELPESFAGQGQFADELDEAGVVGIGPDGLAEAGDQPGGGLVPVLIPASMATSSRRNPATRRTPPAGRPTLSGWTSSRRARKNLRVGGGDDGHSPEPGSIAEPFTVLAELQQEGLIKHLGISTVSAGQVAEAQSIAPIVCVQNLYNLAHRDDDDLIDSLAAQGIAYVPYFPLGGFSPLQSDTLESVAARLNTTPMAVALAWLLQRSPDPPAHPRYLIRRASA